MIPAQAWMHELRLSSCVACAILSTLVVPLVSPPIGQTTAINQMVEQSAILLSLWDQELPILVYNSIDLMSCMCCIGLEVLLTAQDMCHGTCTTDLYPVSPQS